MLDAVGRLPALEGLAALRPIDQAAPGTLLGGDCDRLPGELRAACSTMADRPHLAGTPAPGGRRAVPWHELRVTGRESPLATAPPSPVCASSGEAAACRLAAAAEAVAQGDADLAAAACTGLADPTWRDECFFRAAEAAAPEPTLLLASASLCLAAGAQAVACLSHAVDGWTTNPPAPDDPAAVEAWNTHLGAVAGLLRSRLEADDADWLVARLRACATERLVRRARRWPLDVVAAEPRDLRASLAARLVAARPGTHLEALADSARAAAAGERAIPDLPLAADPPLRDLAVVWDELSADDAAWLDAHPELTVVPYRGSSSAVRATHPDPAVDATIAVLEAAARASPPRRDLVDEGLRSSEPAVRWTATRLARSRRDGTR